MVKCTGRGLVVKRPVVLSKVQMLNLVLGVGVFSLLPARVCQEILRKWLAPILWAPGILGFFLQENLHAHKVPRFREGGNLDFFGGGKF